MSGADKLKKQDNKATKDKKINNYVAQNKKNSDDSDKESVISQSFSVLSNSNNQNISSMITPKSTLTTTENPKTTKKMFDYKYIIGKGGFGKVWKV